MPRLSRFVRPALAFAFCVALAPAALPQAFPSRPIRLVVGSPPGGIDAYVRLFGPRAAEVLGQPVVIENRGGANGAIGADYVARAASDGYTLLFATSGALVHGVILNKNTTFDPLKDFTPIANMIETLKVMTVHASLPFNSVAEVIDYAKRHPGKLTYASSGNTTIFHITGELFKVAAGVDILHIPYKGTGAMATELMSGRVDVGFAALNNVRAHLSSGKLKLLAVAETQRYAALPNTPTISETVPSFLPPPSWNAIVGPAGLPRTIVERLNAAFVKSLQAPEVRNFIEQNGAVSRGGTPEDLGATLRSDFEVAAKLLKATAIQAE
jgi:tripartite-type tricarboxylate transporter receptor subunit TctC